MDKHTKELIRIYNIDGMKNIEIAAALGISERTVYRYLAIIREEPKVSFKNYKTNAEDILKLLGCQVKERMDNKEETKLKFISTPTHGYLLVPCEIMNKYPEVKKEISDFSWITDGIWYLEEDADASLFMDSTGTKYKDVEHIDSEDDIGVHVMSPHNSIWRVFYNIMCVRLDSHPCDATTLKQSRFVLKEFFPEIDMEKSLKYFRSHGGYCDCEVLMNVEDSSDNIKIEEE